MAMGCIGVWVGTRFLATEEGGALPVNKQRILDSTDEDTRVSTAYTGKTLRASYNKFHDLWAGSGLDPLPFPMQSLISSHLLAAFIEANKNDYVGGRAGQVSGINRTHRLNSALRAGVFEGMGGLSFDELRSGAD